MFENTPNNVRLKDFEIKAIKEIFFNHFLDEDRLWLFGSRVDLNKRGGDIDLYIETNIPVAQLQKKRMDFINDLCDKIGDQKIDVVVNTISESDNLAIYTVAKTEGVQLL